MSVPVAKLFDRFATNVSDWLGRWTAFAIAAGALLVWLALGPYYGWSQQWSNVGNDAMSAIAYIMLFVLQYSACKQSLALTIKTDEIIRAMDAARNDFVGIEDSTEEELRVIKNGDRRAVPQSAS
jgi:low affinity Fe/Cu permease